MKLSDAKLSNEPKDSLIGKVPLKRSSVNIDTTIDGISYECCFVITSNNKVFLDSFLYVTPDGLLKPVDAIVLFNSKNLTTFLTNTAELLSKLHTK